MLEVIEGQGRLKTTSPPESVWDVRYRFEITSDVVRKPGFPTVTAKRDSTGWVRSLDGRAIPEGTYELQAQDGEILRVENASLGEWGIVAS
jgi:hypothetical protein